MVHLLLADGPPDVTNVFLQLGAIGALALLLLWFALGAHKDAKQQRDECQDRVEQLQKDYITLLNTVLPLVTQATNVLNEAITEVRRTREGR